MATCHSPGGSGKSSNSSSPGKRDKTETNQLIPVLQGAAKLKPKFIFRWWLRPNSSISSHTYNYNNINNNNNDDDDDIRDSDSRNSLQEKAHTTALIPAVKYRSLQEM